MQVYLVGVRGDDYRGDIAVDDIFFKQCGNNIILKDFIFYNHILNLMMKFKSRVSRKTWCITRYI